MKLKFNSLFFVLLFFNTVGEVQAASCCASSGAAPSLITGDDRAQLSFSYGRNSLIADAPPEGLPVFRKESTSEIQSTYRITGTILLTDLWQGGVQVPFIQNKIIKSQQKDLSASGLGDLSLLSAYEFLPERVYSSWKPRGFIVLQFVLPTGTSIYNFKQKNSVDVTGKGFYSFILGHLFLKKWTHWDLSVFPELQYSFSREFISHANTFTAVGDHFGGRLTFGVGYSPANWNNFRFGFRLQPQYEQSKKVLSNTGESEISERLFWNTSLDISYAWNTRWKLNINYTDQTLLGPAINSTLGRTLGLSLQHHWIL